MPRKKKAMKPTKIRFTEEEKNKIQLLADTYAGGNFSKWVRHAAINADRKVLVKDANK
jgi:hypothetical protein